MDKGSDNIKISVIIAINGDENNIRGGCIDSVLNQSLDDIEVICVQYNLADVLVSEGLECDYSDARIKVFSPALTGINAAYNYGMSQASGQFVHFLDFDDCVLPYAYEAIYNKLIKYELDMIRIASINHNVEDDCYEDDPEISFSELRPGDFNRLVGTENGSPLYKTSRCAWSGLYKKEFIDKNNLYFPESNIYGERAFFAEALISADRIMISRDRLVLHNTGEVSFNENLEDFLIPQFEAVNEISDILAYHEVDFEVRERIMLGEIEHLFKEITRFFENDILDEESNLILETYVNNYRGSFAHALRTKYREVSKKLSVPHTALNLKKINPFHEVCQNPKVSVVVPTYNVEDYLNEALNSLTMQQLKDMEFICINDGSTDNSMTIMREYAAIDKRFKILDGPNGGYGKGMNRGMDAACGEYMGILEPDDFVPVTMFGDLYKIAKVNDLDFVKADFCRFTVNNDGSLKLKEFPLTKNKTFYNRVLCPIEELETFKFVMNTWSGIYKIDFLRQWDIRHNETPGASYQDNGFWFQTFSRAKRVMFVNKKYYMNRRDNPNSSMFSSGKMYAVTKEYKFIYEKLSADLELWKHIEQIYWIKKFDNFFVTLYRLKPELQDEYVHHLNEEFKEAYEQNLINCDLVGGARWIRFCEIMENPDTYLSSIRVSVIIPVYNAEKWISQTLDSLLVRNEIPFEIICVDDGSTDNSLSILREYEKNDFRVRVITQKNAGAGAARNAGMALAKGEYLSFLDADDFFEPNMIRFAYDQAISSSADIVVFRSDRYWENSGTFSGMAFTIKRDLLPGHEPFAGDEIQYNAFRAFSGYAWDKFFRAEFVRENNLRFLEQPCINDQMFTFCAVMRAEKICTNNNVLAHYRRPEGALTFARDEGIKWRCFYDSLIAMREKLKEWNIFERREQDFINYSLYFSLWNLSTLHEPAYHNLYDKLKNEWFDELGISAHDMDYFYDRGEWNQLQMIYELSAEEFLFWRTENLTNQLNNQRGKTDRANRLAADEKRRSNDMNKNLGKVKAQLSGFIKARMDIKNEGGPENDLEIFNISGLNTSLETPGWFKNNLGIGHVVRSDMGAEEGRVSFKLKCIKDGTLHIRLMGNDVRRANETKIPYWIDYMSLEINGEDMLDASVAVWHNSPHMIEVDVCDGEIIDVNVEFKSHAVGETRVHTENFQKLKEELVTVKAENKALYNLLKEAYEEKLELSYELKNTRGITILPPEIKY